MSVTEAEFLGYDIPDIIPKPTPFRSSKHIRCGRKIISIDQLYGWRGMDTGYYGSEDSENEPDFMEEVKLRSVENNLEKENLDILKEEAEEKLEKERKARPNFNILTDRPPVPDFSVTYIETSYSINDETDAEVDGTQKRISLERQDSLIDGGIEAQNELKSDQHNGHFESMEVDGSSCEQHFIYSEIQRSDGYDNTSLRKSDTMNVTYNVEPKKDEKNSVLNGIEDGIDSAGVESTFVMQLDGTFIVEKLQTEQNRSGLLSSDCEKSLDESRLITAESNVNTGITTGDISGESMTPPRNNGKMGHCSVVQQNTDLSCTNKFSTWGTERNDGIGWSATVSKIPLLARNRTIVSFKTPKQRIKAVEYSGLEKHAYFTPLFKKERLRTLTHTSTPISESNYICARFEAHHAALANRSTQTGIRTPLQHGRCITQKVYSASTPIHHELSCSKVFHLEERTPTAKNSTAQSSRIPVLTHALRAITQYGTSSPVTKRSSLVDYNLTPRTHMLNEKRISHRARSKTRLEKQTSICVMSTSSKFPQRPLTRFAYEHLKSGGTPRPTSATRRELRKVVGDDSAFSEPKTPTAKPDISQMLVDDAMKSGPAYRRCPRLPKLLPPIGKLQFQDSNETLDLSSASVNATPAAKQSQECTANKKQEVDNDSTQRFATDSSESDEVDHLAEVTRDLSIQEYQNTSSKDLESIFDSTVVEYRRQQKVPNFDTGSYFGRRRILSILNESSMSVNTPGKETCNAASSNSSPIHIVAARDKQKEVAVLPARKIVRPEKTEQGLRRSSRNRIAPIRSWLGEKPIYQRDKQGTYELVGVQEAVIDDPLFLKYNTIDMGEVIERRRLEQKQHSRARKLRGFARRQRTKMYQDGINEENFKCIPSPVSRKCRI